MKQTAVLGVGALMLVTLAPGHQQYWSRFGAGAAALKDAGLSWPTVCQCNVAVIPRLHVVAV